MLFYQSTFSKHNEKFLQSAPITVRMAGFESDTLRLQNAGWQISVETVHLMEYDGHEIRVALKHDGIKQVALARMHLTREYLHQAMFSNNWNWFKNAGIEIQYIAPVIKCHVVPTQLGTFSMNAIDARPQFIEKDLNDIAMFKPIKSENFELYFHQKDEAEILDWLLKKQDPKQKEIRQNMKRRQYLEESAPNQDIQDKINTDVKHQLVLVS